MKVVLIQRKPASGQFSIEGYFDRVIASMRAIGLDCDHRILPWRSRGLLPRIRILAFAARNQGDVTHITGDITFAGIVTRADRTVLTIHDCEILERTRGLKRFVLWLLWFSIPARRAAAVTVISEATKARLLHYVRGLDPAKVHVVPVSVSEGFVPTCVRPMPARPTVLQIGTKKNKNVRRLIDALAPLPCRLVLVGEPDTTLTAQLLKSGLEHDVRTGVSEDEMIELYRQADVVSFVSTYEGFGMPIIEAQRIGRPVVTANRSSMPEVAGAGACFVDPYNVRSIRAGFSRVITDSKFRETLVAQGRMNSERFRTASIADQYVEIYKRTVLQAESTLSLSVSIGNDVVKH